MSEYDLENAFQRVNSPPPVEFEDLWPSESRGDGKIKKNNLRTGAAQGNGSFILKAGCIQCGFPVDLAKNDHSGGSLDGNGACFVENTGTATTTLNNGTTHTENYGTPGVRAGSGCPMCGTKNSTHRRIAATGLNPTNSPSMLGF